MLGRMFKKPETRAPEFIQGQLTPWGNWTDLGASSHAGINVTTTSAQQLLAVYGCVQLIAGTISTLPRHILREENGQEVQTKPKWFDRPNPSTTMVEFISQTVTSLLLNGNAYWVYGLDGNLMPNELAVLDPATVTVNSQPGPIAPIVTYEISGRPFRGKLMHLKGICAPGSVIGIAPIDAAKQSIGVGLAAQEFAARFYSNGASLSGVIETDADLTLLQARDTVRKFAGDHAGLANAHRPGMLDNGAHWKPLSVAPEQAQFLESRQFQAAEICSQMFLVDPAWFGMALGSGSTVTYNNLESQGVRLATFTLTRWLVTLEAAFYELLPRPQAFKFNLDGLKRGDLAARGDYYTKAIAGKWLSEQEARDLEDLGPMPADLKKKLEQPEVQMPVKPLQAVPMPALKEGTG